MSAKLIFKMEFYKFFNDKKYLIIAIVLGIINFVFIHSLLGKMSTSYYGYYSTSGYVGMSVFMSIIFLFIYPFHALAIDYKNNVMALMMASGVNRTKLYFSKIGSTIITGFLLVLIVLVIPIFLATLRYASFSDIGELLEVMMEGMNFIGMSPTLYNTYLIVSYLSTIVTINMAVIFMKGSSAKSVLLFFGIQIVMGMITSTILDVTSNSYWLDSNDLIINNIIVSLIVIVGFGFASLRQLNTQNL